MATQLNLFDGLALRDEGIGRAVGHADRVDPDWSKRAYQLLVWYAQRYGRFMVEDVRNYQDSNMPPPPSERAWGGIVRRAVKAGIIRRVGYRAVSNPKAHATPATVWEIIK